MDNFIFVLFLVTIFMYILKFGFGIVTSSTTHPEWLKFVPGPKPFPISFIGNIAQFTPLSKVRRKFFQLFKEYPYCFKLVAFSQHFVVLNSPKMVHSLLKSGEMGILNKSFIYDILKPFMRSGLIVANAHVWEPHRRLLNPSMNYHSLRMYMDLLNNHSRRLVTTLETLFVDEKPRSINAQLNCTFLEIICELITGSNAVVPTSDVIQYHHNFQMWKASAINRLIQPWLLVDSIWRLHPLSKEFSRVVEELHGFARKIWLNHNLQENNMTRKSPSGNNEFEEFSERNGERSFVSMLSMLKNGNVGEEQVLEEINSMLLAGHETVATTMHFFCFLMASKPEFQALCREEVDLVFLDPMQCYNDYSLTYEALSNLKYVERCILETLRLFPPVFAYIRQIETSLSIEIQRKTIELSPQTNVIVVPSALQMNPKYFPNPKEFNPDRFLPEEVAKRPLGVYIPFSAGPRGCLGRKFAMMELKVMAAFILRHFEISTKDSLASVPIVPYVTLTPKRDYLFTFQKRRDL